jgi:hypothetical protein
MHWRIWRQPELASHAHHEVLHLVARQASHDAPCSLDGGGSHASPSSSPPGAAQAGLGVAPESTLSLPAAPLLDVEHAASTRARPSTMHTPRERSPFIGISWCA